MEPMGRVYKFSCKRIEGLVLVHVALGGAGDWIG